MRISKFPPGIKALHTDFESISANTEAAFHALLQVFSPNPNGVLFDALLPVVSKDGTNITVSTPAQRIGVQGAISNVSAYTEIFNVDDGMSGEKDLRVEIYFVMQRKPVTETRNFLSLDPTTMVTILQNLEAEVATITVPKVVYLWTNNLSTSSQVPIVAPTDVGYLKLATVTYNGTVTTTGEPQSKFTLPNGVVVPVQLHGSQHLSTGTDPIPLAALDNTIVSGSREGLLPAGALYVLMSAPQDIVPANDSRFLTFASLGSNTVVEGAFDPKLIEAGLRTDASLTTVDVAGSPALGVKFAPKSAAAGVSDDAARRDHKHALSESGLVVVNLTHPITPNDLGTLISKEITAADLPNGVTIAQILDIKYYWEPPNLDAVNSHDDNLLALSWYATTVQGSGMGTIGARTNITSNNTFEIEIGSVGLMYLTPIMLAEVQSWTNPQYGHSQYPQQGTLHITVLALREGANG